MLKNLLPNKIYEALSTINIKDICEIRIRKNSPITINISGTNKYLSNDGLSNCENNAIIASSSLINYIIQQSSNNALYTINDQLINGYISVKGGIRIGIAGEVVTVNNQIKTIKNITSLNIRIPHEVKNCSLNSYLYLVNGNNIFNTLILSPAGAGKTTFLRDFAYQLKLRHKNLNILIVDERNEITGISDGEYSLGAKNIDIYSNCTKSFAFENGIRSMKPDVILTDELNLDKDIDAIENAVTSGVKVIATIHANSIHDLKNKKQFKYILNNKMFNRFVVLSNNFGVGTLEGIFDENFNCVYS